MRETRPEGLTGAFYDGRIRTRWPRPSLAFDALAPSTRQACVANAERFDVARFRHGIADVVAGRPARAAAARATRRGAARARSAPQRRGARG